jgi:polysaccharide export outer membrane protein
MKKLSFLLLLSVVLTQVSCISSKKYYYLQGEYDMKNSSANYEPIIQKDDRISIMVTSVQKEMAEPFNMSNFNNSNTNNINIGYLVDSNGNIDFPVLGKISVAGYTVEQLKLMLKDKLSNYLNDAVINVRILNFKVTVLGAVSNPGVKNFGTNRVTLLDALGEAGDLTVFGKRENILIIRDYQGVKSFHRVDISDANFVNSPFYYLDQNDMIYVQERKAKVDATSFPSLPLIVSILSLVTTVLILINR